jgi:hypothetical protein
MFGNPNENSSMPDSTNDDRRVNTYVREIFEEAYVLVLPFVDPQQGWGGQALTRHAYPALHEAFPRLDMQDLAILVPALERVFRERSKVR